MATERSRQRQQQQCGPSVSSDSACVWLLLDSRPGHRNQVLGLSEALGRQISLSVQIVEIGGVAHGMWTGLAGKSRLPASRPDAILAAGHSTHLPLLMLGRRLQARTVLLMKSTLPCRVFDMCLVPDVYNARWAPGNVLLTTGVLNRIQPSSDQDVQRGLVLIGGPSGHHGWSNQNILDQLQHVLNGQVETAADNIRTWTVATSRRTPSCFLNQLQRSVPPHVHIVPAEDVTSDWLPEQLRVSGTVWVTGESVSMLYEAVTSGAQVGLLELPRKRKSKATRCIDLLLERKAVTPYPEWVRAGRLQAATTPLNEADRCARELLRRGLLPSCRPNSADRFAA